jgi:hypothetical protein
MYTIEGRLMVTGYDRGSSEAEERPKMHKAKRTQVRLGPNMVNE